MDPAHLQDRIHWALNTAARAIGIQTDAYRPSAVSEPLDPVNRFLRLRAAFTAPDGRFARPNAYGDALWHGVFDAAYTRPGDYLVQEGAIWFIAAQQRLLPVLCVRTNRVVAFWRPAAPTNTRGEHLWRRYDRNKRSAADQLAGERTRRIGQGTAGERFAKRQLNSLLDRAVAGISGRDPASIRSDDG